MGEFHMDSASVIEVTTSDPVFAQVSRAYAMASSWSGAAAAGAVTGGFNSGSFGGYAWSMTGGKNLLVGTTQQVQTPVISQPVVVAGPITTNPVVGGPVANASASSSASASASASAGASASAHAVVQNTTPKPNPWSNIFGTNNWSGFFG